MLQFGIPELPESISVETCLIGRDTARLKNLEVLDLSSILSDNQPSVLQSALNSVNHNKQLQTNSTETILPPPIPMTIPTMPAATLSPFSDAKTYTETEINTDGPNPMRDRSLQTEATQSVSLGVQCNLEKDIDDADFQKALADDEANLKKKVESAKKQFTDYVQSKTKSYENGKFECMVCGEIKPKPELIASHMALHWGPPKLCLRCGQHFEHAIYWKTHNCVEKRTKKRHYIKCPYYSCEASAISPAELNDHLNEHCGLRPHRCRNCKRGFATFGELRLHRKLHKACSKHAMHDIYQLPKENTLYRKRVFIVKTAKGKKELVKSFLSQLPSPSSTMTRYCSVCLKRCKNKVHYQQHITRCQDEHKRRLRHKRDLLWKTAATTNGINGEKSN